MRGRLCVDSRADWTSATARIDARSCASTTPTRNFAGANGRRRRPFAPGRGAAHRRPRAPRARRRGDRWTCQIEALSEHVLRPPRSGRRGTWSAGKCPIRRFPDPVPNHCSDRQTPFCAPSPAKTAQYSLLPCPEADLHRPHPIQTGPHNRPSVRTFRVGGVKNLRLQNAEIVFSEGVRGPPSALSAVPKRAADR